MSDRKNAPAETKNVLSEEKNAPPERKNEMSDRKNAPVETKNALSERKNGLSVQDKRFRKGENIRIVPSEYMECFYTFVSC